MAAEQIQSAVGVDLGTCGSRAAFMDGREPRLVNFGGGAFEISSSVSFYPEGPAVGLNPLRESYENPAGSVDCVKRLLGREHSSEEAKREAGYRSYRIVPDGGGFAGVEVFGEALSAQDVLAVILDHVKRRAEKALGLPAELAVLSVPGSFDFHQRAAARLALSSRFKNFRLISDHGALCLSYLRENRDFFARPRRVLVLDAGGGFAQAALVEMRDEAIETQRVMGSAFSAGEDIDRRLAGYLKREFLNETGVELKRDRELVRFRDAAASAKSLLSASLDAQIVLSDLLSGRLKGWRFKRTLSRRDFEELAGDVIRRILSLAYGVLEGTGAGPGDLDLILMAGKTSMIPALKRGMIRLFTRDPVTLFDSQARIARGAAIHAGDALAGNFQTLVLETLPASVGIDTGAGRISLILERNNGYPAERKAYYTTASDNQSEMYLRLVQGDPSSESEFRFLGNYKISGVPPAPRGESRVEVSYQVQGDGLFELEARELSSGKTLTVSLEDRVLQPVGPAALAWMEKAGEREEGEPLKKAKAGPAPPREAAPPAAANPAAAALVGRYRGADAPYGERIREDREEGGALELIRNLIPVLDNLNLALSYANPEDGAVKGLADGVGMTLKGFLDVLGKYGVREIKADPGDNFDPNFQEAMGFEPGEAGGLEDGRVARMVNRGYLHNSKLLRPIQVTLVRNGSGG
ncbi:MAG: nucleotide exchange factor GrpE [Deltaproteobacteria bacterium]|jgi:molecular chaperone DnaK|nr:nucleotide exchange factor GrpE [Deltaproteobacteria bacterium]